MFHDDKAIRSTAKKAFVKLAPEDAKQDVKNNWQAMFRHRFSSVGEIGDAQAVEPLIKLLNDGMVRWGAAVALGKIGDVRAVKPLIKTFEDENLDVIKVAAKALVKIKEADIGNEEKKNILKFLKSKDPAMVRMGASILKGILEE